MTCPALGPSVGWQPGAETAGWALPGPLGAGAVPLLRVFLPLPTGLGGGSASGKTTVARMIIEALDVPWVVLLSMDSFYKVLTRQQQEQAAHNNFNFDHPDAFDFDLIISTLKKLKQGKSVKVPIYDFTTHSRKKDWKTLYGANVIIFEGIMAFADKTLLEVRTGARLADPPAGLA